MNVFLVSLIAKTVSLLSRFFVSGAGVTWPGEISLRLDNLLIRKLSQKIRKGIIIVAGTNGKTTTASMIHQILKKAGYKVIHNTTGANLRNGIAGTLILQTNFLGLIDADFAVFEVDEATFPLLAQEIKPKTIVLLNLFRDQLDRYGEVDAIARKWRQALKKLDSQVTLIANADDPLIAYIGQNFQGEVAYFGLKGKKYDLGRLKFATDSIYCLVCGSKFKYRSVYLSHYGDWYCPKCGFKKPAITDFKVSSPLPGVYNIYNSLAAVLTATKLGIAKEIAQKSLFSFTPSFGRQEIFELKDKKIQLFLSKNPAGFNESLRTVMAKDDVNTVIFALNDRIPDGRDVSWIWDVDFEEIVDKAQTIICCGERVFDMALRIKYSFQIQNYNSKLKIYEKLKEALNYGLENTKKGETLYIFPTYSAMLEIRKILIGRKIL